jgi:3-methyladenine DNA glycosylase/8-oxoguanine DNA glycosylase
VLGSHGLARLAPNEIDEDKASLTTTLLLGRSAHTVRFTENPRGTLAVTLLDKTGNAGKSSGSKTATLSTKDQTALETAARKMFSLDDDLAPFYAAVADDADLSFATRGVGRMFRSPTAFEDVVRTICTTNCAWSGTTRMIEALVAHLGKRAPGAPKEGWRGRAFPTPDTMAAAGGGFYRDLARAGYRGAYLQKLAELVAEGSLDLEAWRDAPREKLSDQELEERLLELPGVGPYAAAHTMLLFGRHSRLVLDSWTRPYYAEIMGKKKIADRTIARRFKKYGADAGLAFWLLLWKERHLALGTK